ncbi:hypothetical protein B0J14DRAFT_245044 [Halenospora varia]|nr:hypothetical protein B0J14DRAFT_245044 [Halenospora varia]
MPLNNLHQLREMTKNEHNHEGSLDVQHPQTVRDEKDSGYEDFEEFQEDECLDSEMEGSILHRPRPKKPVRAPTIPARSEKRASKMLNDVMLELQNMDGSMEKDMEKNSMVEETNPHELYLSSEEDASLSDDYDDSLSEFEVMDATEETEAVRPSSSRASSRKSQEVTARVVSFTMVKPQIVDIFCHSPPKRPVSVFANLETSARSASPSRAPRRPSPLKLYPKTIRRMSISSIASLSHTSTTSSNIAPEQPVTQLPPRKSSRMANLASLVVNTKQSLHSAASHAFLHTDPFASPHEANSAESETPTTPKTPTSMAAAAFKKGLTRGLNKARKPSMNKLSSLYSAGSSSRNESMMELSKTIEQPEEEPSKQRRKSLAMPTTARPSTSHDGPLRYEDIMKNVIRAPPPKPQTVQSPKRNTASMLLRRKSVKA